MLLTNKFLIYVSLMSVWSQPALGFEEGAKLARLRRMTQLPQRFRFDLPDALTGEGKRLPHLLESVLGTVLQPKPHLDDPLLTRGERLQHGRRLLLQVEVDGRV